MIWSENYFNIILQQIIGIYRGEIMRNKSEEEMQKESYEAYLDRLSMPGCPVKLSDEEVEKLIKEGRIKPLYEV